MGGILAQATVKCVGNRQQPRIDAVLPCNPRDMLDSLLFGAPLLYFYARFVLS